MSKKKSHIGKKIEGLEYYPVLEDVGCGACLDESLDSSTAYDADTGRVSDANTTSKLYEVVSRLGGPNSKSGTVVIAMSGGVDSSVLPAILTKLGYKCIGVHMQFWSDDKFDPLSSENPDKFPENKCCSLESLEHAREIAHKYGMPFYVLNTRDTFKENIVDYFVEEFSMGVTPNPCVECNRSIKFGYLIDKMKELGADYIATGHYVRNEMLKAASGETRYALKMATDKMKDQSYFLYTVTQEKLKHCIFPLADFSKEEIRQIAEEEGLLKVAKKKDSQGICFFPEKSHVPFLKRHMKPSLSGANTSGPMLTKDGEEKGSHAGLAYYTIGQRQGLDIGGPGGPWYVIGKDPKKNALIIGSNEDLFASTVRAVKLTFVSGKIPPSALTKEGMPIMARLRHRFTPNDAILKIDNLKFHATPKFSRKSVSTAEHITEDPFANLTATVTYLEPQRAVTPGQSIVFYQGDEVLGGGIIV